MEVRWAEPATAAGGTPAQAALADRLARFGHRALHHLNHRVEVSVLLCDRNLVQTLNARYRGIAAPTDVLSFAQHHDARTTGAAGWPDCPDQGTLPAQSSAAPPPAGDVVIAVDVAASQAAARGEPEERELCRLLLHGMLHLVGMDHADPPREHEPMLTLQERTLSCLLGDPASTTP